MLDLHWPRGLVDWNGDRLLVLLPGPREHEVADRNEIEQRAHTLSGRLITATKETVPGLVLTLAISRYTPEPERLGAALEEANLALSIGERIGSAGDVVTFEETGTYKLLFQIFADRPEELAAFYEQTLGPLVRYDEQYQTELVATLATYLEFDCNLAATAASLFTHRHTIRYRLDRIAELCGLDIGRTDDREKLSLGLKSMRLLGRRVPTPIAKENASPAQHPVAPAGRQVRSPPVCENAAPRASLAHSAPRTTLSARSGSSMRQTIAFQATAFEAQPVQVEVDPNDGNVDPDATPVVVLVFQSGPNVVLTVPMSVTDASNTMNAFGEAEPHRGQLPDVQWEPQPAGLSEGMFWMLAPAVVGISVTPPQATPDGVIPHWTLTFEDADGSQVQVAVSDAITVQLIRGLSDAVNADDEDEPEDE